MEVVYMQITWFSISSGKSENISVSELLCKDRTYNSIEGWFEFSDKVIFFLFTEKAIVVLHLVKRENFEFDSRGRAMVYMSANSEFCVLWVVNVVLVNSVSGPEIFGFSDVF